MIGSIVGQNKHFSDAAKTPKDTSYRGEQSQRVSAQVSSRSSSQRTSVPRSAGTAKVSGGSGAKPSFEGLMSGSSTMLQFKGSGYDKKSAQTARYAQKPNYSTVSSPHSFTSDKRYSIMDNYSCMTSEKSSSDRLSSIIKNNSLF